MNPSESLSRSAIVPRRIAFEFADDIAPHWIPGEAELSQMINGASLVMPYLEPFLIRTIRQALPQLSDPGLIADAQAFMAQEGQHFRAHRRFNEVLKSKGYPELAQIEDAMTAAYARLDRLPLSRKLAYAAGFESMTIGLTQWLVGQRHRLFAGADSRIASFVLWHMVEETEHKTVAFDVYQAVQGGYWLRVLGVLHGSLDVMRFSRRAYHQLLRTDGLWNNLRSRLRLAWQLGRFLAHTTPSLLAAMVPGHNPRQVRDQPWTVEWLRRSIALGDAAPVPLIDTNDPAMPVPFPMVEPSRVS